MITLKVKIKNQSDAKVLARFLRTLEYVKSVSFEKPEKPLADEDWILPGRPATETEIKQLFEDMDKDGDEGITTQQLKKEIAQWSKRI
ncbi:MAG: hypothetical protein HC905_01680 [Bacteroidales bacterium]|nr:hypothetical protein [Bacteroidales bacterium]